MSGNLLPIEKRPIETSNLIQFNINGEIYVTWFENEREFKKAADHIRNSPIADYTLRTQVVSVTEDGEIRVEWHTIASYGIYAKKGI